VLRAVALGFWVTVFFSAPDDLVLPFLARDELGASPFAIGVTMAAASLGLVVATPMLGALARRGGTVMTMIVVGGLVAATGNLVTALAPVLAAAFMGQLVRGIGVALFDAAGWRTLLQREVPPRLMGRALANIYGGVGVAAAIGYLPGGWLMDATSPRVAFVVIGLGGFAGVALTVILFRRAPPSR
jgi:MFS family permease